MAADCHTRVLPTFHYCPTIPQTPFLGIYPVHPLSSTCLLGEGYFPGSHSFDSLLHSKAQPHIPIPLGFHTSDTPSLLLFRACSIYGIPTLGWIPTLQLPSF